MLTVALESDTAHMLSYLTPGTVVQAILSVKDCYLLQTLLSSLRESSCMSATWP